jgi:hypothetical protein
MAALQMELRTRDAQKNELRVCEPRATLQTLVQYSSVAARTVARISHVLQIRPRPPTDQAVTLIFAHASGMVNVIARGAEIKGAQPRLAGERQRARASFPDGP